MAGSKRLFRRLFSAIFVTSAAAGLAVLVFLAFEVWRKIDLLNMASSDNVQWTLAQAEVEFFEMQAAVSNVLADRSPDLSAIRQEFDIFYSRVDTLETSPLYGALRGDADYAEALMRIRRFLDESVPLIDADDATLRADLPLFAERVAALRPLLRDLSLTGLEFFALNADERREAVATTLVRLAMATVALLSGLIVAAFVLARLNRLNTQRAHDLQRTSARLSTIVSTSLDAIVVADRAGYILEFNPAAERIFGHYREAVIGRSMGGLIVPEKYRAAHEAGMARYRDGGEKRVIGKGRVQLEAMRANGEIFPVELSIQSAEGLSGEIFVSFLRDISHRVASENELIEARDKAVAGEKAKAEFLAVMSHEIRTPLNGLLGTLSLLKDTRLTRTQSDHVARMETSGALLLRHVNDVLDISKYEAGRMEPSLQPVDLNALVQGVIDNQRDVASAGNNVLDWRWVGPSVPWVETDPEALRRILINLVGNAVKFTQDGRVTLELSADDAKADGLRDVTLRVIDTGLGIRTGDVDRMFRDFETGDSSYGRRVGGTGLGLGIARRLTETLGGEIGADSALGQGSTFWVRLPMRPVSAIDRDEVPETAVPQRRRAPSRNILIVEDNEINRTVLREMLKSDGHTVTEAHDGGEGVRLATERAFDLILMDISMPVMDGRAASAAIRASGGACSDVPIVAVTAHALPAEIEAFRRFGIDGCLRKPINRTELRALLTSSLEGLHEPVEAEADTPASPLLDESRVDALAADLGQPVADRLLSRFLAEGDEVVHALTGADKPVLNLSELAETAHKLAGTAATFGALALHDELARIEHRAKSEEPNMAPLLDALGQTWTETREAYARRAAS